MPRGDVVINAKSYMPFEEFPAVLNSGAAEKKHLLVWLADYIRLLACKASSAASSTSLDADVVWVRPFPFDLLYQGHGFAAYRINPVSRENNDMTKRVKKLCREYCTYPLDYRKAIPPFASAGKSPMSAMVLDLVEVVINGILQEALAQTTHKKIQISITTS